MRRLLTWARRKLAGASTLELMHAARDENDREMIAVVALLDVDEVTLEVVMGDVELPDQSALHCRADLLQRLATEQAWFVRTAVGG